VLAAKVAMAVPTALRKVATDASAEAWTVTAETTVATMQTQCYSDMDGDFVDHVS